MNDVLAEYYCHHCGDWITELVHERNHHNSHEEPDRWRDDRVRVDGVIYDSEDEFYQKQQRKAER